MSQRTQITVRLADDICEQLCTIAQRAGLSANAAASAIITAAIAEGWTVQPAGQPVAVPADKNATS